MDRRRSQDGALLQLVHDHHEHFTEAHKRNRERVEAATGRLASLESGYAELRDRVTTLERTPLSVEKVSISGAQWISSVVAIVVASLGLAAGLWQLHIGINDLQATVANAAKLQDERNVTQKESLDNLGRQMEMRRVEIQRLRDDFTDYIRQKTRP